MKRVALYARVSTDRNIQDPELQLRELRLHCQQRGLEIAAEYVDKVSSAKVRPNLELMLQHADEKKFDAILVWKFDRVARSAIELCQTLQRLQNDGVTFTSLTEQIDTATAAGKLVFTVLGAVAEMERSLIRERVRAGLRNAVAKGRRLGRPPCPIPPETVRITVDYYNGSIRRAAVKLGISCRKAYDLYHEARVVKP
jgi:DNA invertase Pin-like site-specific DNA recombinase